jgi:hypothetical protein
MSFGNGRDVNVWGVEGVYKSPGSGRNVNVQEVGGI